MITTHLTIDLEPALAAPKALLYFIASWCTSYKTFGPILDKFSKDNPDITIVKIDINEKQDLLNLYDVYCIPTIIALEYGAEKSRNIGVIDESELQEMFA